MRHKAVEAILDVEEVLLRPGGKLGELLRDVCKALGKSGQTGTVRTLRAFGEKLGESLGDISRDLRESDLGQLLAQLGR